MNPEAEFALAMVHSGLSVSGAAAVVLGCLMVWFHHGGGPSAGT